MLEDWTIYSWYCPNCRNEVAGLKNSKNQIRVKCKTCGSDMLPFPLPLPEFIGLAEHTLRQGRNTTI